jgi:hypothetical protein
MKLPISAMVVGFNEAHFLDNCLSSLSFCDEIIYTDLGSSDNSVAVAQKYCSNIYMRGLVPSGEFIQSEIVQDLKNDWVVFLDPDEVVDISLANILKDVFENIKVSPSTGAVLVPWLFYFKRRPLMGTVWGGVNSKYLLVNKNRFEFLPVTHYGRRLRAGFSTLEIKKNLEKTNVIHHYWMNSYLIFFKKHFRYLKYEGRDQFNAGRRIKGLSSLFFLPVKEFWHSYIVSKGYKDNFVGFSLSIFWSFYQTIIAFDIMLLQIKWRCKKMSIFRIISHKI